MSQGDTPEKALEMIRDAQTGWLSVALEDGAPIPEPRALDEYSGKFVVHVPRSVKAEGVSLNQYINVALARDLGQPVGGQMPG